MRARSTGMRVRILGPLAAASDPLWLGEAPYLFLSVRMCRLAWEAYETGGGPLSKAKAHVGLQQESAVCMHMCSLGWQAHGTAS